MIQINGGMGAGKTTIAKGLTLLWKSEGKKVAYISKLDFDSIDSVVLDGLNNLDGVVFDHFDVATDIHIVEKANELTKQGKQIAFVSQKYGWTLNETSRIVNCDVKHVYKPLRAKDLVPN